VYIKVFWTGVGLWGCQREYTCVKAVQALWHGGFPCSADPHGGAYPGSGAVRSGPTPAGVGAVVCHAAAQRDAGPARAASFPGVYR
jgi:hypothetical protein